MLIFGYVRAYIGVLGIKSRSRSADDLEKLEPILKRLQHAVLNVNADKLTFGVAECKYLDFTRKKLNLNERR